MRTLQKKQERTVMKQSYRLYKTKPGLMAKPPHRSVGDLSADPRDWGQEEDYLFI